MDSFDSANLLSGGSRLLSQSPQFSFDTASSSSHSHTGPGGEDLSLSELYPDNHDHERLPKTRTRPSIAQALGFGAPLDQSDDLSVLGALEEEEQEDAGEREEDAEVGEGNEADVTVRVGGEDTMKTGITAQSRDEKLQSDLFVLRQLNGAFAVYNDALREAQGGTEVSFSSFSTWSIHFVLIHSFHKRLAEQLEQTDALLNKYINILSKSEQVTRLIFDERWMGAEAVCGLSLVPFRAAYFLSRIHSGHRMKRSSRRRNASVKRSGFAMKKSVDRRRSENKSGGKRRSSSGRCAKKWSGFNARRRIGLLLGAVVVCGVYAVRVRLCVRVPPREGAREQVCHFLNSTALFSSSPPLERFVKC